MLCIQRRTCEALAAGGPKNLLGKWDTFGGVPGISFPDGNKWTKVLDALVVKPRLSDK